MAFDSHGHLLHKRYSPRRGGAMRAVAAHKKLLAKALAQPGAFEDHPWGETVVKVGTPGAKSAKVFVFFGHPAQGGFGLSVKLPESAMEALERPFCAPTGYGLGKAGWVSCRFTAADDVPYELLEAWLLESWRAVAPKKLQKGS